MRVLHCATDLHEEANAFAHREPMSRGVRGDRVADHVLHHDVREPRLGGARVVDVRDVGMIHHRERLLLGSEARDNLARVAARAQNLDRNLAPNGFVLLGEVDGSHAALAKNAHDPVRAHAHGL